MKTVFARFTLLMLCASPVHAETTEAGPFQFSHSRALPNGDVAFFELTLQADERYLVSWESSPSYLCRYLLESDTAAMVSMTSYHLVNKQYMVVVDEDGDFRFEYDDRFIDNMICSN